MAAHWARCGVLILCLATSVMVVCAASGREDDGRSTKPGSTDLHEALRRALRARNAHTVRKLRKLDYTSRVRGVVNSITSDVYSYMGSFRTVMPLLVPTATDRANLAKYAHELQTRWSGYANDARKLYRDDCTKGAAECIDRHIRAFIDRISSGDGDPDGKHDARYRRRTLGLDDIPGSNHAEDVPATGRQSLRSTARKFARKCKARGYDLAAVVAKRASVDTRRNMTALRNDFVASVAKGVGIGTRVLARYTVKCGEMVVGFAQMSAKVVGDECMARREADMYPVDADKFVVGDVAMVCVQVMERWIGNRMRTLYRLSVERVGSEGMQWIRRHAAQLRMDMKRNMRQMIIASVGWMLGFKTRFPDIGGRLFVVGVACFLFGVFGMVYMVRGFGNKSVIEVCTSDDCYCGDCPSCSDGESERNDEEEIADDGDGAVFLSEMEKLKSSVERAKTPAARNMTCTTIETGSELEIGKENKHTTNEARYINPRIKNPVHVRYE